MLDALLWNLMLSTGMAILVAGLCRWSWMDRRPALKHALWLLVLAKLVAPPLISTPVLPALKPALETPPVASVPERSPIVEEKISLSRPSYEPAMPREAAAFSVLDTIGASLRSAWPQWLAAFSLVVSAAVLLFHTVQCIRLNRHLSRLGQEDERLAACCAEVAAKLGYSKPVRSRVIEAKTMPILWGLRRPTIVFNRQMLLQLSDEHVRSIVAHELAHIVRRDAWSNLFAFSIRTLFWWNPLAWWAYRQVRAAQELCCDAMAIEISKRSCYAEALLAAVELSPADSITGRELVLAIGPSRSMIRRFEMIADSRLSHRTPRWMLPLFAIIVATFFCLPVRERPAQAQPPGVSPPAESEAVSTNQEGFTEDEAGDATTPEKKLRVAGENEEYVVLVAVISTGKQSAKQAWLLDRARNERLTLSKGEQFQIGKQSAVVMDIQDRSVTLKIDETAKAWELGKSFAELKRLGNAVASVTKKDETTSPEESAPKRFEVQLEVVGDALIVRGPKEDVSRVTKLLEKLNETNRNPNEQPPIKQQASAEVHALGDLDGQMVMDALKPLFGDSPQVRMMLDMENQRLLLIAPPDVHTQITRLLKALSRPAKADEEHAKFKLAFNRQPWDGVLKWYADQAGLSLSMKESIDGTFNYRDSRAYTATEVMDVLNGVLLTRERTLIRDGRWLFVLELEPKTIRELAPRVSSDQLASRGRFEYVTVLFKLKTDEGKTLHEEIVPLLSPGGSAILLEKSRVLVVTERAGVMRTIQELIKLNQEVRRTNPKPAAF